MSHNHTHGLEENHKDVQIRVLITILMNLIITTAEFVFGLISGSLLLVSDAVHNMGDTLSGVLTFFTMRLSTKSHNERFTFGYKRAEIISAFVNSSFLLVVAALIIRESITRFYNIEIVKVSIMLPVAIIGLVANLISVLMLHSHTESLNVKSAYLHLLFDTFSSVAVVLGGIFMYIFNFYYLDPILSLLVAAYMGYEAFDVFKESLHILMEGAPLDINLKELEQDVLSIPGVKNIHHVHIWFLSEKEEMFEAHVNVEKMNVAETGKIRREIEYILKTKYSVNHSNIQFEEEEHLEEGLIHN